MMRGLYVALAALLVAAAVGIATGATNLAPDVANALSAIDSVPTKLQLNHVFEDEAQALQNLADIARDGAEDTGIRLRAIHALAKYCPQPCSTTELAHQALSQLIAEKRIQISGEDVVLLRAAIETIGQLRVASDVNVLVPLLDHPSRDVRAGAARALRDLCNPEAIWWLRVRYTAETTEQVQLAISEALRILGQCSANP